MGVVIRASRPPRGGRGLKYTDNQSHQTSGSRPPRGGRGLKLLVKVPSLGKVVVAPLAGGVD